MNFCNEDKKFYNFKLYWRLASGLTGCASISTLDSLVGIFLGIMISVVGLNICAQLEYLKSINP